MKPHALAAFKIMDQFFGEESAKTVLSYMEEVDHTAIEQSLTLRIKDLATKGQISVFGQRLDKTTQDIEKINQHLDRIDQEIEKINQRLDRIDRDLAATNQRIADTKAELIKWMFIFWIGQVAATFSLILLFLKK